MDIKEIIKSKTIWAGTIGIISAFAGYFTNEITLGAAVNMGLTSFIGIFLRTSIEDKK